MQEFLKNINLYDSDGIPPNFRNSGNLLEFYLLENFRLVKIF
jgi:hypothetical protein